MLSLWKQNKSNARKSLNSLLIVIHKKRNVAVNSTKLRSPGLNMLQQSPTLYRPQQQNEAHVKVAYRL